jgi:hypothetical protein
VPNCLSPSPLSQHSNQLEVYNLWQAFRLPAAPWDTPSQARQTRNREVQRKRQGSKEP